MSTNRGQRPTELRTDDAVELRRAQERAAGLNSTDRAALEKIGRSADLRPPFREPQEPATRPERPDVLSGMHSSRVALRPGSQVEIEIPGADELVRQRMLASTRAVLIREGFTDVQAAQNTSSSALPGSTNDKLVLDVPRVGPPCTLAKLQEALAKARLGSEASARSFVRTSNIAPAGSGPTSRLAGVAAAAGVAGAAAEEVSETTLTSGNGNNSMTAVIKGTFEAVEGVARIALSVGKGLVRSLTSD